MEDIREDVCQVCGDTVGGTYDVIRRLSGEKYYEVVTNFNLCSECSILFEDNVEYVITEAITGKAKKND